MPRVICWSRLGPPVMPMYEYECAACGHRFERIQKFSDPPVDEVPELRRAQSAEALSSPAIQFKGTGSTSPITREKARQVPIESGCLTRRIERQDTKSSSDAKDPRPERVEESRESKESRGRRVQGARVPDRSRRRTSPTRRRAIVLFDSGGVRRSMFSERKYARNGSLRSGRRSAKYTTA